MTLWRVIPFLSVLCLALVSPARADIVTDAEHAILMDAASGQVLWAKDAFAPMPPASMSKLMTLELLFQRMKDGRVKLHDSFLVSERAWKMGGSRMFLKLGSRVSVEDLIRGIIIQSGNDACVAVAEALGGSVEHFAEMMNRRAREIGLRNSHFVNPDGYPEPPGQAMSAYDLAVLARHLVNDYPAYYHYFAEREFTWNNIRQPNRNLALQYFPGADGLKTGHTDEAGYGLVVSAVKDGRRFILVLSGLRYPDLAGKGNASWFAERRRGQEAARVLGMAFREYRTYALLKQGEIAGTLKVWGGSARNLPVTVDKPLSVTMAVPARKAMKVALHAREPLYAPIKQGEVVGSLVVSAPGMPDLSVPVKAVREVPKAGILGRIWMGIEALLGKTRS